MSYSLGGYLKKQNNDEEKDDGLILIIKPKTKCNYTVNAVIKMQLDNKRECKNVKLKNF